MNYSTFVLKVQPYSQTCDFFVKYNVTVFSKTSNKSVLSTPFYQPDNTLFVLPESLIMLLLLLQQFLSPVHQTEPAHILQIHMRMFLFRLSWSEAPYNTRTILSLEYLLQ